MSRRSKQKKKSPAMLAIGVIVAVILVFMISEIVELKKTEARYLEKEAYLQQQYEEETQRSEDLKELEERIHTRQYIEDIAKSKLGLAYENEIIFKESGD